MGLAEAETNQWPMIFMPKLKEKWSGQVRVYIPKLWYIYELILYILWFELIRLFYADAGSFRKYFKNIRVNSVVQSFSYLVQWQKYTKFVCIFRLFALFAA